MQTKTYFASSVPAALEVARQELGEDALLVNSRPAPPEARQYGRLEVTFAWERKEKKDPLPGAAPNHAVARKPPNTELDLIRQELSALRSAVGRGGEGAGLNGAAGGSTRMRERLAGVGLDADLAAEIAVVAFRNLEDGKQGDRVSVDPAEIGLKELTRRIGVVPFAEIRGGECRTLAFVGPPGRGKTTTLIKLAVKLGLEKRVPVRIYSAGAHCVGAQEQMARYAAILGVPWHTYESLDGLSLALNGDGWSGLRLIDTPGMSAGESDTMRAFGVFFSAKPEIERHLVLRADTRSADMLNAMARYAALQVSRLLFTGVDEALNVVSMADTLARSGVPATFAGTGQNIPDDLEEVSASKLAKAVWSAAGMSTGPGLARSAAA